MILILKCCLFFLNLSVLVPYIILNVMDVFLPEVIFVSDKGLHHLNTWTILKDQGWLGGIQNTKISKPESGERGPLDLPSLPRQKMRSWCSLQQPPWKTWCSRGSPGTSSPFDFIKQGGPSAHDTGGERWDQGQLLPVPASPSIPCHHHHEFMRSSWSSWWWWSWWRWWFHVSW